MLNVIHYKTRLENLKDVFNKFDDMHVTELEEGVIRGASRNLSYAVDDIHDIEGRFLENSITEIHIKSKDFEEVFYGNNTMETLMELTIFNFNFNQEDINVVEFEIKGIIKKPEGTGFYLLKEKNDNISFYKGVNFGENVYFYFKRNITEEIIIESSCGSIKKKGC